MTGMALLVNLLVGILLTAGVVLAVRRRFEAHRWVQTAGVILSLVVALWTMALPAFAGIRIAGISRPPAHSAWITWIHAVTGSATLALGVFVILRGNGLMIRRLRFRKYKPIMWTAYALYVTTILLGVAARFL